MGWYFYGAKATFDRYREKWDELNKTTGNHILLDSTFVGALVGHFGSDRTLLAVYEDDDNSAMVIVEKIRPGFWQTFQPSQGPLGLLVFSNGCDLEKQMIELMRKLPGYTLGFSILQQDPDFTAFATIKDSPTVEVVDYAVTSRVVLIGDFESFWEKTGRYFADDLRRQTRRLQEQGIQMEFVAECDASKVAECVRDYAVLEGSGWKGKEGSAVTADGPQGLFYREILEKCCARGEAIIYRLLFNGRVVASDLCLQRNGMTVVLKIAYDEHLQGISPGKFIHREMLKLLFEEGKTRAFEWYGRIHEWQRKMGSTPRRMYHLNFYRHEWVPVARDLMKQAREIINRNSSR